MLQQAQRELNRLLVNCQVGPHMAFAFQPSTYQFSLTLNVFSLSKYRDFCVLQSRAHEIWARFFGSSMKDDLRYTTSDCFDTFPFPNEVDSGTGLEEAGRIYCEFRADLMVRNNEGLTKTYNRFHDPDGGSPDILKLRELHAAMDRAVLDAYGWTDLKPTCAFLLDYEDEEDQELATSNQELPTRRRRKPWLLPLARRLPRRFSPASSNSTASVPRKSA